MSVLNVKMENADMDSHIARPPCVLKLNPKFMNLCVMMSKSNMSNVTSDGSNDRSLGRRGRTAQQGK
jgi:hypothetical protein